MIAIHGQSDRSAEFAAAEHFSQIAAKALPILKSSPLVVLHLFPSVQCFGQKAQDIDLIVFFADYRDNKAELTASSRGKKIHSFCAAIEVKGHSPEDVIFEGPSCFVRYHGELHNVTLQSEKQKHSVRKYIEDNSRTGKAPWIVNLIWLTRVQSVYLPSVRSNVLGSDCTWESIVEAVVLLGGRGSASEVAVFSSNTWMNSLVEVFAKRLEQSKIDRKRLEAITKSVLDKTQQQYAAKLGHQLLIFRGRGGTGKTVRLIRIAYQAYRDDGSRVLLLTYNKALVADIRRQLALLKVQDAIGEGSVAVKTIHSFVREWLVALQLISGREDDFLGKYEELKAQAIELLMAGAIADDDLAKAKAGASRELAWDLVLIDECQDWPKTERDLIYQLYGHKKVIIADGVDQFVRGVDRIDWRENISPKEIQVVTLRKSLRLKSALCQAVGYFAELIEFQGWNLEPLPDSHGGKVVVVTGDGLNKDFHRRIEATAKTDGNRPIDLLLCVPPSWVKESGGRRRSIVAEQYERWGLNVWDAVAPESRGEYPTSLDQFRIVQYESCRGLEGWTVVAFGIDELFDLKVKTAEASDAQKSDIFYERESAAFEYAKKWVMIPLTRAIDTLVLHVSDESSYMGRTLRDLHEKHPDEIPWVRF